MSFTGKKNRQWWIPSLIVLLAILALGLFLPNLIFPSEVRGDNQTLTDLNTPTSTLTATLTLAVATSPVPAGSSSTVVTASPPSLSNCTYTMYHWLNQPDSWMIENIVIGASSFGKAEALAILGANPIDPQTLLLQQFFAALLNTLKGTDATTIRPTLIEASQWIDAHPLGVDLSLSDQQTGLALLQALNDYNNGFSGPGHCPDEPSTPTPLPSPTPTATLTPTPTPPRTQRPTPTETQPGGGGDDSTPVPTDQPTDQPTEKPTDKPTDQPTSPPQPTKTKRPTPTSAPPPTEPPPPPPTDAPPPSPADAPGPGFSPAQWPAWSILGSWLAFLLTQLTAII